MVDRPVVVFRTDGGAETFIFRVGFATFCIFAILGILAALSEMKLLSKTDTAR